MLNDENKKKLKIYPILKDKIKNNISIYKIVQSKFNKEQDDSIIFKISENSIENK